MALTSVVTDTLGDMKVTVGTLSGGDDAFTFDVFMNRFWIGTPAAAVTMVLFTASASHAGIVFGAASVQGPFPWQIQNRPLTLKGTSTQVVTIIEELTGNSVTV